MAADVRYYLLAALLITTRKDEREGGCAIKDFLYARHSERSFALLLFLKGSRFLTGLLSRPHLR